MSDGRRSGVLREPKSCWSSGTDDWENDSDSDLGNDYEKCWKVRFKSFTDIIREGYTEGKKADGYCRDDLHQLFLGSICIQGRCQLWSYTLPNRNSPQASRRPQAHFSTCFLRHLARTPWIVSGHSVDKFPLKLHQFTRTHNTSGFKSKLPSRMHYPWIITLRC